MGKRNHRQDKTCDEQSCDGIVGADRIRCRIAQHTLFAHIDTRMVQRVLGVVHVQVAIIHLGQPLLCFHLNTKRLQSINPIVIMGRTRPERGSDSRVAL